jgi:hypothetical protein
MTTTSIEKPVRRPSSAETRLGLLLALIVGCGRAPMRDIAWERHATALSGPWSVQFSASSTGAAVTGTMELTPNRSIDRAYPPIGVPTNYGTYAVAFRDLGGPPSGTLVPAVVAGFVGEDSVFVLFETDRETFAMQMRGRFAGDSVSGTWRAAQSRGTIAAGTFTMRRQ